MKKILVILVCVLGIASYTIAQSLSSQATAPEVKMQSVNNSSTMSSGSAYSSDVQEVGACSPTPSRPRRSGEGGLPSVDPSQTTDDPKTPQYGPIGDAMLPLMLMAAAFGGVVYLRRRKASV